ncbi:MAG: carboxymuconolactone decarboxylase family protein, partial [Acidimicrobiales bacterium]
MQQEPRIPRIPPLPAEERVGAARELLDASFSPDANIFTTLVRHPGLFRRWLSFGGKLLNGKLPGRDRELLILRTSVLCSAEYEWAQHVPMATRAGVTGAEIEKLRCNLDPGEWAAADALLLKVADELHGDWRISTPTWEALAERYSTEQLIEVAYVVGHYHLLAGVLNSLGVQIDDGLVGFKPCDVEP